MLMQSAVVAWALSKSFRSLSIAVVTAVPTLATQLEDLMGASRVISSAYSMSGRGQR